MPLSDTQIYRRLEELSQGNSRVRALITNVDSIWSDCTVISETVVVSMPQYTLHNRVHLENVVKIMGWLIPKDTLANLSPLELASLILAAGLHDIGMAIPQSEVSLLLDGLTAPHANPQQASYLHFRSGYPGVLAQKQTLVSKGISHEATEIEGYLLAQYLRKEHAERAYRKIFTDFANRCKYGNVDFTAEIARVCRSHTADPSTLRELACAAMAGQNEYCNWRIVALILRLADILDFDAERTPAVLFRHLGIRDPISVTEWRKHTAIEGWIIQPGRIGFRAACSDPVIQKTILDFVDIIEEELLHAHDLLASMFDPEIGRLNEKYELRLPRKVDTRQIGPVHDLQGPVYQYHDLRFELDHHSIMQIIMGLSLYGERYLFLRELLQNAVDACRHRLATGEEGYQPQVTIELLQREGRWLLTVEDNGMGMDEEIVRRYFARIGRSYYHSVEFAQRRFATAPSFRPASRFGIGVLSVFMAGDHFTVDTLQADPGAGPLSIEIADEGALFWFREGTRSIPGTRINLRLTHLPEELFPGAKAERIDDLPSEVKTCQDPQLRRLAETVAYLAPHSEIPLVVRTDESNLVLAPRPYASFKQSRNQEMIKAVNELGDNLLLYELDFADAGLNGIEGRGSFALLVDEVGQPVMQLAGSGVERFEADRTVLVDGCTRGEVFTFQPTTILRQQPMRVGEEIEFGAPRTVFETGGRFCQHGFQVPVFPFGHSTLGIWIPAPLQYDVNFSGDYALPLTADRKNVIWDAEETREKIDHLSRAILKLILTAIGNQMLRENAGFFRQLPSVERADAKVYKALLENRLAPSR